MKVCLLGVIGPVQLGLLALIMILILLILLAIRNAKHKEKAKILETLVKEQMHHNLDPLDRIERLNKMRESGALTQEEFEIEKKKLLK